MIKLYVDDGDVVKNDEGMGSNVMKGLGTCGTYICSFTTMGYLSFLEYLIPSETLHNDVHAKLTVTCT